MDYKIKYLKYKAKYFELLDQIGGNITNSLIVTHNGRIRCLLDSIGIPTIDKSTKEEIRFKNCAILLLSVTKDGYTISLEYDGNLAEKSVEKAEKEKRKYYTKTDDTGINAIFQRTIKPLSLLGLKSEQIQNIGSNTYNFYIVRHGDGVHNSMGFLEKAISSEVTDAELTKDGIAQAEEAKVYLSAIKIDKLYVSDLKRTRQTLGKLIEGHKNMSAKEIVVLQCAHELVYVEGKNCDANQGIKSGLSYENKPKCSADKDICNINDICCKVNNLPIDWYFYRAFYGDGTRMKHGNKNPKECRDTNMIQQAIAHIQK